MKKFTIFDFKHFSGYGAYLLEDSMLIWLTLDFKNLSEAKKEIQTRMNIPVDEIGWKENPTLSLQLMEYFNGKLRKFDFPFNIKTTNYQSKIYKEINSIEYGQLASYKDIATKTGNKNASRAVGNVCSKNLIPLIIPCHRVISSSGTLGGYAYGIEMKKRMIEFESLK